MSTHNGTALLSYDPLGGEDIHARRIDADTFRKHTGPAYAWLFDPWSGARRHSGDVASDPLGLAIVVPDGVLRSDAPPTSQADVLRLAGNTLTHFCHQASYTAGWWTDQETGLDLREVMCTPVGPMQRLLARLLVPGKLCLTHSELSEAMEGHRKGLKDDKLPHRSMLEVELADAVIRIADLAGALGLDLGAAIAEKMAFNAQRPDHKLEARAAAGGKSY